MTDYNLVNCLPVISRKARRQSAGRPLDCRGQLQYGCLGAYPTRRLRASGAGRTQHGISQFHPLTGSGCTTHAFRRCNLPFRRCHLP